MCVIETHVGSFAGLLPKLGSAGFPGQHDLLFTLGIRVGELPLARVRILERGSTLVVDHVTHALQDDAEVFAIQFDLALDNR